MAVRKYLDNTGLAEVANHVNTRLKTVSAMPVTADEGAVRLYTGETSGTFIKGHIYQMKATAKQYLQFSADESTYFMTEDGTITDVAPASYSPQIENVSFTDESTGATLVYMAGNNALVQKLGNDVNVITVNFNKIKTSVMPWWTAGAATGSYNPFTIRNVQLVAVTAWVDITPSGGIKTVTVMPEYPSDKDVVIYTGESGMVYEQNHIYQYDSTEDEWMDITAVIPDEEAREVAAGAMALAEEAIETSTKIWKGSEADWDLLPISEKIKYDYVAFDEEDDPITAATLPYDNTDSGLVSTNVQGAIDETQGRITAPYVLQGRRFICIGDSYSIGQNPEHSTDGRGWCFYLKKYLNIPTEDFFMPTAADVGSLPGFYPTSGTHKSFKDQLITMESYVDDLSTITDIVVAGGYNDAAIDDEMLVTQGFGDFIEHVNATFTNVNVWVGCIGATTNLTKAGFNLALQIPYIYSKSCVSQVNSSNVGQNGNKFRYLDNCESAFRYYEQMSTDKIHPTELGYNILSFTLASAIKGFHGNDMFYGWLYEDSNYEATDFGTTSEHWFKNAFIKDPTNSFDTKIGTTMVFEQIKNNMAFLTVTFGAINNPTINNWEYPQEIYWISDSGLSIKTKPYFEVLKFTSGLIIPTGWSECEVVVPAAFYTEWSNGTNRLEQVLSGNYIISNQGVKVQLNATHITNQTPEYRLVLISMSGFSCTFPATFA